MSEARGSLRWQWRQRKVLSVSAWLSVSPVQETPSPVPSLVSLSLRACCSTVTMPAVSSSAFTPSLLCHTSRLLLCLCPHPFSLSVLGAELLSSTTSLEGNSPHASSPRTSASLCSWHTPEPWFHLSQAAGALAQRGLPVLLQERHSPDQQHRRLQPGAPQGANLWQPGCPRGWL